MFDTPPCTSKVAVTRRRAVVALAPRVAFRLHEGNSRHPATVCSGMLYGAVTCTGMLRSRALSLLAMLLVRSWPRHLRALRMARLAVPLLLLRLLVLRPRLMRAVATL